MPNGILIHTDLERLLADGTIHAPQRPDADQVQPTSLDLRLGAVAHRIAAGFLPGRDRVADRLKRLSLHTLDLDDGAVLETGQLYLIPLLEELALPELVRGRCNPKSSTGRIDLFTRVIVDRTERFDDVPAGYRGPMWLEVMPRSFPVRVRTGQRLNQIRLLVGDARLTDTEHLLAHKDHRLIARADGQPPPGDSVIVDRGFHLRVRLMPWDDGGVVGWRARRFTGVIDLDRVRAHDPAEFFEPIRSLGGADDGRLLLEPEEFYIFASRERIRVPPHLAAEMSAYDVGIGELRTNYAGFFDAGFGHGRNGERDGTPAVLEVRPHDVPFLIEDGQVFFRLEFFRTVAPCQRIYGGAEESSHYSEQGLTLAKFFRDD